MSVLTVQRPEIAISGLMAVLVHVVLFSFLVMGVSWKQAPPPKVVVELWRDLPRIAPLQAPPPPPAKEDSRPPPAKSTPLPGAFATPGLPKPAATAPVPAPRPRPAPPAGGGDRTPSPGPAPEARVAAAKVREARDAARRERDQQAAQEDRQRREERKRLQQAMQEEARRRLAERERLDAERRAAEEARKQELALSEEDERRLNEAIARQQKVVEEQKAAQERVEAERRAAVAAALKAQEQLEDYTQLIRLAIRKRLTLPPGLSGNPQVIFAVKLLPSGKVAFMELVKSSGVPAYDRAVERAIDAPEPLPVPDDPELFDRLRDLTLVFRPSD